MCGACGVRPQLDWYAIGVPTDRAGRAESLGKLAGVLNSAVAEHAGRVSATLAGTALLVAAPNGASKVVTGVPDALEALRVLFPALHARESLDPPRRDVPHHAAEPSRVVAALPADMPWENFAWWFACAVSSQRRVLREATAQVPTPRGSLALELQGSGIRAARVPAHLGSGVVHLGYTDASVGMDRATILGSLRNAMLSPQPRADHRK